MLFRDDFLGNKSAVETFKKKISEQYFFFNVIDQLREWQFECRASCSTLKIGQNTGDT